MTRDEYEQHLVKTIITGADAHGIHYNDEQTGHGFDDPEFGCFIAFTDLVTTYGEWRATRAVAEAGCVWKIAVNPPEPACFKVWADAPDNWCPACKATVKLDAMMEVPEQRREEAT